MELKVKTVKWLDVYPRCKKIFSNFILKTEDLASATYFLCKILQKEVFGILIDSLVKKKSDKEDYLLEVKK